MWCRLAGVVGFVLTALVAECYPPQALAHSPFDTMITIGETIGRYRIVGRLGTGGMGVVYRAQDLDLHRPVALKFLPTDLASDDEGRARFLREARMAAALNHPNTCTVFEVGELQARPFIAMELIEGETLAARLSRSNRLAIGDVLDVAIQVAEGLAEAHSRHIVHRDLKPHNVMVTPSGRVKILDFGLAKPLETARTGGTLTTSELLSTDLGHTTVFGTCSYMSPEQALGKRVDQRSDMFAFGIILYELVSGTRPFDGETPTEILAKVIESEPEPLSSRAPDAPADLVAIVRRCMQKRPEGRYGDTRQLVADLKAVHRRVTDDSHGTFVGLRSRGAVGAALLVLLAAPLTFSLISRDRTVPEVAALLQGRIIAFAGPVQLALGDGRAISSTGKTAEDKDPGPVPPTTGQLIATSAPIATVSIDGKVAGITPMTLELPAGTHDIVMTTPDGLRWRGRIELAAGEKASISRDLTAVGTLAIVSDVWAEVSLDGGPSEQTPIQFQRVAAGLHELRAFRDGFVPQQLEVTVEPSKVTTIRLTLTKHP
jgi:hypothetical protein